MILFVLVLVAVLSIIGLSCRARTGGQSMLHGLLSLALGVRLAGLATALYLLPQPSISLLAQEAASKPAEPKSAIAAESATVPRGTAAHTGDAARSDMPPQLAEAESNLSKLEGTPVSPALGNSASTSNSVSFITNVKYLATNRPAWLESPPAYEGSVLKIAVKAGPYSTVRKCEPDLESEVNKVVGEFINDHLKARHASTLVSYSLQELRRRKVVREQFSEQLETSVGLMNQVHAQLVFDEPFQDEIEQRWSDLRAKSKLAQIGLGSGVVLMLLTTMFGFLRLDTATKGYYTGRLQFGAVATILGLVAASVLLTKWIPWM